MCCAQADELKAAGVQKIWSVAFAEPAAASEWSKKVGIDGTKVRCSAVESLGLMLDAASEWSKKVGIDGTKVLQTAVKRSGSIRRMSVRLLSKCRHICGVSVSEWSKKVGIDGTKVRQSAVKRSGSMRRMCVRLQSKCRH